MPDESLTHLPHEAEILRSIQTHPELCAFVLAAYIKSAPSKLLRKALDISNYPSNEAQDRVMKILYSMRYEHEAQLLILRKPNLHETVAPIEWD